MERIKKVFQIAGGILLLAGLMTCKDPTNLLEGLEDEVKMANDLYLEIVSISPDDGVNDFNPGDTIEIAFDREIDLETAKGFISIVNANGISFESENEDNALNYSFNSTNNVLSISPYPYFDGPVNYQLSITEGLSGVDGSLLRDSYIVGFTTLNPPRGYITIDDDYINSYLVDVEVNSNGASYYELSNNANFEHVGSGDGDLYSSGWKPTNGASRITDTVSGRVIGTQGVNTIYARYRDGNDTNASTANISSTATANVTFDNVAPSISINDSGTILYQNSYNATTGPVMYSTASDATSGIASYTWAKNSGSPTVTFTAINSSSTNVSLSAEGDAYIEVTAYDNAGNSATSTTRLIRRDVTPPGAPTNNTTPVPSGLLLTSDNTLTFNISAGSGGENSFRYQINNGSWSYTTSTTPTVTVSIYGTPTIEIQGQDLAGNWSASLSQTYTNGLFPTADKFGNPRFYPANGSTGISTATDLAWTEANSTHYYRIYMGTSKSQTLIAAVGVPFLESKDLPKLSLSSTYYWKVEYYTDSTIKVPFYTSDLMAFSTGKSFF